MNTSSVVFDFLNVVIGLLLAFFGEQPEVPVSPNKVTAALTD